MNEMTVVQEEFSVRCQRCLSLAKQRFMANPDWVTFFRETLGVSGMARKLFPTQEEFLAFERTPEHQEIQQLVNGLRNRKLSPSAVNEPTRVITVRLPESLHEALKAEADDHDTSMNRLCISKLLQVLNEMPKSKGAPAANRAAAPANAPARPAAPMAPASHPMQPAMSTTPNFRSTYNPNAGMVRPEGNMGNM